MNYIISYQCISHTGYIRKSNQDNYICNGRCKNDLSGHAYSFLNGSESVANAPLFGVFDGMGGLSHGETASSIAAENALKLCCSDGPVVDLFEFCQHTSDHIFTYAVDHEFASMGTTAALLLFTPQQVKICNIGDTKIFRLREGSLAQLSTDHLAITPYGMKPPLTQYLGSPPDKTIIAPYVTQEQYRLNDLYLICSDGLTDAVSEEDIKYIIVSTPPPDRAQTLLDHALMAGGKDNITIILCQVGKESFFSYIKQKFNK